MKTLRSAAALALFCSALLAQTAPAPNPAEEELRKALADSANSPQGVIRELEAYLVKYPSTPQRPDIEKLLLREAIDTKDVERIARYGESVLAREPENLMALENTIVAELKLGGPADAGKALGHAQEFEQQVHSLTAAPTTGRDEAKRRVEMDSGLGRAYLYQARAQSLLGHMDKAAALAQKSYASNPTADSAREAAFCLDKLHQPADAVRYMAEAFVMPDPREPDTDREADRVLLAEMYKEWKGGDAGLGDVVLEAYDRAEALRAARRLEMKRYDPNLQVTDPMKFTLSNLDGKELNLASLKGKVVVMDFWATWCGPCRMQHPIYEQVKAHFHDRPDVVFLAVDADDDIKLVAPFLKSQGWSRDVYFQDGLAAAMQVTSIPTTVIAGKDGKIAERMTGFIPDRFQAQLTSRIEAALNDASSPAPKEKGHGE